MAKYNVKNILITLVIVGLITAFILVGSLNGENGPVTPPQNNTTQHQIVDNESMNTTQPVETSKPSVESTPLDKITPVKRQVSALLGETTIEILDYSGKLVLTDANDITLKYNPVLAEVGVSVKSGKVWVSIKPLKDEDFVVNLYYKNKLIGFLDVHVINHKVVSVSDSFTLEVTPYTSILKTFTFTIKNEYSVKHTVQIKVFNPSDDLTVQVNPSKLTLGPGESGVVQVRVNGIIKEYPVRVTLSIDGVERYILFRTKPLLIDIELLDNTVQAGKENQLVFKIHSSTEANFYLYLNDKYVKEVKLHEGDNQVTVPYTIPLPQSGTCYLNLASKYGTVKLTLKNPYKEYTYYFNLKILTNNPVTIDTNKPTLTFYNSTSDSTIIVFKNNNNYDVSLTPHYFICDSPVENLDKCQPVNDYQVSFYEVTGQELGKVILKPYQQKLYELTVKPLKQYYEDYEKYLYITFTGEKTIGGQTVPLEFDNILVIKLVNKVDMVKAGIDIIYKYNTNEGGHIKTKISSPVGLPLKNVSVTYWVRGYDGDNFVWVRDKITLQLNEFSNTYNLMIGLPEGYKFFIYYIEVKGEKIEGSKLLYIYPNS